VKFCLQTEGRKCAEDDGKEDARDGIRTEGERRYRRLQKRQNEEPDRTSCQIVSMINET